jgi:fructoselysine-6-P-deglycase FrlB-like protein
MKYSVYLKKRERETDASRRFNRDLKDRFLMLLVYYRLYITFSLAVGFLFDLDKYNLKRYTKD